MSDKTLISHFFNEEYLLPWWLDHHKKFFNKAVLIDYNSTDRSCDIIKNKCPHWKIIPTKNKYFDSNVIDKEVREIEKSISGWKMCLNTTEFLVGDYGILNSIKNRKQLLIGNYIFVDNILTELDPNKPIYEQVFNGFHDNSHGTDVGQGGRPLRSIHNFKINYPKQGGRHFFGNESTNNLYIFYYCYLLGIDQMINRKLQIQHKMSSEELQTLSKYSYHPNIVNRNSFISKITKYQLPKCQNISKDINRLIDLQNIYLVNKNKSTSNIL